MSIVQAHTFQPCLDISDCHMIIEMHRQYLGYQRLRCPCSAHTVLVLFRKIYMIAFTLGILIFLATDNISTDKTFHISMTDRYILSYFNDIGRKVGWFENNIIIAAYSSSNKWLLTSRLLDAFHIL